jgi:hypothetical protein
MHRRLSPTLNDISVTVVEASTFPSYGGVGEATALRDAVTMMYERGETDVSTATLRRALQVLDGDRRVARLLLTPLPAPTQ